MHILPTSNAPTTPAGGTSTITQSPQIQPANVLAPLLSLVSGLPNTQGTQVTLGTEDLSTGLLNQTKAQSFKPDQLPEDVKERYLMGQSHDNILTKRQRTSFTSNTLNSTRDPSGNTMCSVCHHMDGPNRLILQSRDIFYFSKYDEKQSKNLVMRSPKPDSSDHNPEVLRQWYIQFHAHAKAFSIYVHNYYDFRDSPKDPKGFTCGSNTDNVN